MLDADQKPVAFELAALANGDGLETSVGKFGGGVVHVELLSCGVNNNLILLTYKLYQNLEFPETIN
jgi:hypothetical protein